MFCYHKKTNELNDDNYVSYEEAHPEYVRPAAIAPALQPVVVAPVAPVQPVEVVEEVEVVEVVNDDQDPQLMQTGFNDELEDELEEDYIEDEIVQDEIVQDEVEEEEYV